MAAYELAYDEGIVLQSTSAYRRGPSEEDFEDEELMELVVTNKRIIYVSEISKGIFSKTTTEVTQIPITDIKVINGVVQAKQIKHDIYGHCIQIQFVHGVEYWELEKKAIPQWIAEINRLLGVEPAPMQAAPAVKEKKAPAFGALSGFAYCPSHSIREDKLDAQVMDFIENLREQLQGEQDKLTMLKKQYDKKRPAVNAQIQALTAELDRLEQEVDEIIMEQLQAK